MCGIAGILRWGEAPPSRDEINRMTKAVAHRGPDGEGTVLQDGIALGHRRLAIIDPEGGAQPMSNERRTVWITYNGEVYNFPELRNLLEARGRRFRTRSDTEVIIAAYEEWGEDCVQRLRGMFAFALADLERRSLLLARDHFGIKPLYYRVGRDYLAFASELPALRQVEAPGPEGDLFAVELFLRFQYIPAPHSIYRDIRKLPPAHTLVCGFDGHLGTPRRYWRPRFSPLREMKESAAVTLLDETLQESVKAHMISDVPFGAFLSGGVDSTLVARAMARHISPVHAYTIGFEDPEFDETAHAARAARDLHLEHHVKIVRAESLSEFPEIVARYGEPFGDDSALPTYELCRFARRQVPMVLSGDGGDELFAGYASYGGWLDRTPRGSLRAGPRGAARAMRQLLRATWRRSLHGTRHFLGDWLAHVIYFDSAARAELWRTEFRYLTERPCRPYEEAAREAQDLDRLAWAQYLDIVTYLPGALLTKIDIASMAHGLEVRVPFLDVKVFDAAASMPPALHHERDAHGTWVGKRIPRQLLRREFPADFVNRPKRGFTAPQRSWFRSGTPVRAEIESAVLDPQSGLREWFSHEGLVSAFRRYDGGQDTSKQLWLLWVLAVWRRQHPHVAFVLDRSMGATANASSDRFQRSLQHHVG